jgi:hypothetical protein
MQPKMVATESFKADRSSIFDLPSFPPPGVTRRGRLVCDASHTLAKRRISTSPSDPRANARAVLRAVSLKSRARSHKGVAPRAPSGLAPLSVPGWTPGASWLRRKASAFAGFITATCAARLATQMARFPGLFEGRSSAFFPIAAARRDQATEMADRLLQ